MNTMTKTPRYLPRFGVNPFVLALSILVLFYLVLPTLIVIPMSFSASSYLEFPPREWSLRWYQEYWNSDAWRDATWTSLKAALITTLFATPFGTAAAYGLHKITGGLKSALQLVVLIPLIVPIILVGIGAFHIFAMVGLNSTLTGVVVAHVALALPFVVVTVLSGLKSFDFYQERAAISLGASPIVAFLTVTLPQIRISVQTGAFMAFITSLDEVVASMLVSGGENSTLTKRMFAALRDQIDPTIAAISTCLIAVSIAILAVVQTGASKKRQIES